MTPVIFYFSPNSSVLVLQVDGFLTAILPLFSTSQTNDPTTYTDEAVVPELWISSFGEWHQHSGF
ncbi:MAG TPA: hypothetical protein DCY88_16725 [Cyanobacteria bacterium UBA11372]|nr:hypothetical protein [Cyanobacteria bacterium UBA11372]